MIGIITLDHHGRSRAQMITGESKDDGKSLILTTLERGVW
jgi:hypothetical protein